MSTPGQISNVKRAEQEKIIQTMETLCNRPEFTFSIKRLHIAGKQTRAEIQIMIDLEGKKLV